MADTPGGTILTWNTSNWITVVLMGTVGFFLLGLARKYYQSKQGN